MILSEAQLALVLGRPRMLTFLPAVQRTYICVRNNTCVRIRYSPGGGGGGNCTHVLGVGGGGGGLAGEPGGGGGGSTLPPSGGGGGRG